MKPNKRSRIFVWEGVTYPSIRAMAIATGTSFSNAQRYFDLGYTCRADVIQTFEWNGVVYPSFAEASKILGVTDTTLRQRRDAGHTCDDDLARIQKPIVIDGIEYPTLAEAARARGVSRQAIWQKYRKSKKVTT